MTNFGVKTETSLRSINKPYFFTCRRSPQVQLQSPHQAQVALVCQGRNHKAGARTQVLVAIDEAGEGHLSHTVVNLVIPVVAELFQPLEAGGGVNTVANLQKMEVEVTIFQPIMLLLSIGAQWKMTQS